MPKEIDIIPFANNSLTSDFLFAQRKYYVSSSDVYPQEEGLPKPVDIWYDRPLWGKVDTKQRLIFPDQANLKPINDELVAINFVADLFNEMCLEFDKCAAKGQIDASDPFLSSLKVFKAFQDPTAAYREYRKIFKKY